MHFSRASGLELVPYHITHTVLHHTEQAHLVPSICRGGSLLRRGCGHLRDHFRCWRCWWRRWCCYGSAARLLKPLVDALLRCRCAEGNTRRRTTGKEEEAVSRVLAQSYRALKKWSRGEGVDILRLKRRHKEMTGKRPYGRNRRQVQQYR